MFGCVIFYLRPHTAVPNNSAASFKSSDGRSGREEKKKKGKVGYIKLMAACCQGVYRRESERVL